MGFTTESDAWNCQRRCAGIKGCTHFSFYDGDCHVTDALRTQINATGFVSGPHHCDEKTKPESSYVEFLSNVHGDSGLSPGWFVPGISAAGLMCAYFTILGGLALGNMRSADARQAAPPEDCDVDPLLSYSNRTMSVDGRFRPASPGGHDSDDSG